MLYYRCEGCGTSLKSSEKMLGRFDPCPKCGTQNWLADDSVAAPLQKCPHCGLVLAETRGKPLPPMTRWRCLECKATVWVKHNLAVVRDSRPKRKRKPKPKPTTQDKPQPQPPMQPTSPAKAQPRPKPKPAPPLKPDPVRPSHAATSSPKPSGKTEANTALTVRRKPEQSFVAPPGQSYSLASARLADELKQDFDRLSKQGVDLDEIAAFAKPAGIGAGLAAGLEIHPLVGLGIAAAGFLTELVTDGFKKFNIEKVRQKWLRRLTSMNETELQDLALAIQVKYPLLLPASQGLFANPG